MAKRDLIEMFIAANADQCARIDDHPLSKLVPRRFANVCVRCLDGGQEFLAILAQHGESIKHVTVPLGDLPEKNAKSRIIDPAVNMLDMACGAYHGI